jgi:hypothetical protein
MLQDLTLFVAGSDMVCCRFQYYMLEYIIDVCVMMTYGRVLKDYLGCMVLTLEYGLRDFLLKNNVGCDSEVMTLWL